MLEWKYFVSLKTRTINFSVYIFSDPKNIFSKKNFIFFNPQKYFKKGYLFFQPPKIFIFRYFLKG